MLWCLRQTIKRSLGFQRNAHAGAHGVKIAGLNAHVMIKALRNPKVGFLEDHYFNVRRIGFNGLARAAQRSGFKSAIASRRRWHMNRAVLYVTPMVR